MSATVRWLAIVMVSAVLAACNSIADYPYMKEGEPHAEEIVRSITEGWNADKLIETEDPRMQAIAPAQKVKEMIAECAVRLGAVKSQKTMVGSTGLETGVSGMVASYIIDLDAEKGVGRVTIKLQKVANRWMVLGFWIQMKPSGNPPPSS